MIILDATSQLQSAVTIHVVEPDFGQLFGGDIVSKHIEDGYTMVHMSTFLHTTY